MSKALRIIGTALLVTASIVALPGVSPLVIGGVSIGASTLSIAGAVVLTGAAALAKRPKLDQATQDFEQNLRLSLNPTAPRRILYGTSATGGDLVYRETTNGNKDLWMVIALAGHEIDGFQEFQWGGQKVAFSGNNAAGDFKDKMFLYQRFGKDNQTAVSALTGASSGWTTNHRLRGVAYAVLKLVADADKFASGVQNALFILRGRKLYDPRKDSTNGGSGTHRLNDQSTWEFSENPVLAIVDYLRGIRVNNSSTTSCDGQLVAGMGVAADRIDWANIIAEANICDEQVPLKAGGSEKRYTCNGWIDPSSSHRDNLDQLASAMSGTVAFQGGKWRVYAAAPRAAVKVRNEDHIIGGLNLRTKKSVAQKINVISARYPDVEADYQIKSSPPLRNSTYITQDGGSEHPASLSLPMCTSKTQAQRHMKIALERSRREMAAKVVFSPVALQDQAMDTIQLTYGALGLASQKMMCVDWSLRFAQDEGGNTGLLVEEELIEEDDSVYVWDAVADEQTVPVPGAAPRLMRTFRNLDEIGGSVDFASQVGGAEKPQDNADVTGQNTAADTAAVDGVPAADVQANATRGRKAFLMPGYALKFDGNGDAVLIPYNAAHNSADYTVILKFRTTSANFEGLVWKSPDTTSDREIAISINNGKLRMVIGNGVAIESVETADRVDDGEWHVAAFRIDRPVSNDRMHIFLDDVFNAVSKQTSINHSQNSNEIVIGKVSSNSNADRYFEGEISEVALYNAALSGGAGSELERAMFNPVDLARADLVGFWAFDEGEGTDAFDSTGTSDGVHEGNPQYVGHSVQGRVQRGLDNLGRVAKEILGSAVFDGDFVSDVRDGAGRARTGFDGSGILANQVHSLVRLKDRLADNINETGGRKWAGESGAGVRPPAFRDSVNINPNFRLGSQDWSPDANGGGGSFSFSGGQLIITQGGTSVWIFVWQSVQVVKDQWYEIVAKRSATSGGGGQANAGLSTINNDPNKLDTVNLQWDGTETGEKRTWFKAGSTQTLFALINEGSGPNRSSTFDYFRVNKINQGMEFVLSGGGGLIEERDGALHFHQGGTSVWLRAGKRIKLFGGIEYDFIANRTAVNGGGTLEIGLATFAPGEVNGTPDIIALSFTGMETGEKRTTYTPAEDEIVYFHAREGSSANRSSTVTWNLDAGGQRAQKGLAFTGNLKSEINSGVLRDRGDGVGQNLASGFAPFSARDGDVVSFSRASPPQVIWGEGGVRQSSSLSGDQYASRAARNLSSSGFTAELKVKETASGISSVTQTTELAPGSGEPDEIINKTDGSPAFDDIYNYRYDVTVFSEDTDGDGFPDTFSPATISHWANYNGAGWVEVGSRATYTTSGTFTVQITIPGLDTATNTKFGITAEEGTLNDFDRVFYQKATAAGSVTATPSGVSAVPFFLQEGNQGDIQ